MSPNEIAVLLHCYTTPEVHPRIDAPAVIHAISMFLGCELISQPDGFDWYVTTDKGRALVKVLCNVKFPTQVWTDDNGNIIELN